MYIILFAFAFASAALCCCCYVVLDRRSSRDSERRENEGFASDTSEFVVKIHETSETTFVVNAVEVTSKRMVDLVGASPARKLTVTDVASNVTHSNLTLVAKEPLDGGSSFDTPKAPV